MIVLAALNINHVNLQAYFFWSDVEYKLGHFNHLCSMLVQSDGSVTNNYCNIPLINNIIDKIGYWVLRFTSSSWRTLIILLLGGWSELRQSKVPSPTARVAVSLKILETWKDLLLLFYTKCSESQYLNK